jgi:hypothetical protein
MAPEMESNKSQNTDILQVNSVNQRSIKLEKVTFGFFPVSVQKVLSLPNEG